jgi:hypothetical protein
MQSLLRACVGYISISIGEEETRNRLAELEFKDFYHEGGKK